MQGRTKLIVVFFLLIASAIIPLFLAHYVINHTSKLHLQKRNHGEFVQSTSIADLQVMAPMPSSLSMQPGEMHVAGLKEWSGRWLLIYDSQNTCCEKQCQLEMHQLHQVRVASHNGIERSLAILLLPAHCATPELELSDKVWRLNSAQIAAWKERIPSQKPQVLIVDPNGWVVLKYPGNVVPKWVYEDMRILLHTSQIG
jgi:hypothetical protein